jgi:hypothetical protein
LLKPFDKGVGKKQGIVQEEAQETEKRMRAEENRRSTGVGPATVERRLTNRYTFSSFTHVS